MPKKLTQHEIRQRAVQTLFGYEIQKEMADTVLQTFQHEIEIFKGIMTRPPRFEIRFQDERIVIRDFSKQLTGSLNHLMESYEKLGIDLEKSALSKALTFARDFGSFTKKMRENEALTVFQSIFANLNLVQLLTLDLGEEAVGPQVLTFLRETEKAPAQESWENFNQLFAKVPETIREKYTPDTFQVLLLSTELEQQLSSVQQRQEAEKKQLLQRTKDFVLNYDQEGEETLLMPDYLAQLIDGVLQHQKVLQATISEHLAKNWSFKRLTTIERAVLSLGAYEIIFTETPDIVAIDEAIELSKDFSDEKSSKFVNGVLTNLIKTA